MDRLIKATAKDGMVRIIAADTRELVNEASKIHNCTATAAAALGRMLTAGALLGSTLKNKQDAITLQIKGGGEAEGVVVTSYYDASVKGYIGNPNVELPVKENGKLDVGGAIGTNGNLVVIRDMGLKEPYVGQVPIYSGEIAEDLAYYFTVSEQTPSAVSLGVLVDVDYSIKAAGGFIIQMMPDADPLLADLISYRLEETKSISYLLSSGKSIDEVLEEIFADMDLKISESITPRFYCDCSMERVERALVSIGKEELNKIYHENKDEELLCHFCNKRYVFTHEHIGQLLKDIG